MAQLTFASSCDADPNYRDPAWHHFIPVSTLYSEIYNIYSYFLGSPPSSAPATKAPARQSTKKKHKKPFAQAGHTLSDHRLGGDTQADDEEDVTEPHRDFAAPANEGAHEYELRDIGARGQEWMNKFGQTKDMEIYCYRLALGMTRYTYNGFPARLSSIVLLLLVLQNGVVFGRETVSHCNLQSWSST